MERKAWAFICLIWCILIASTTSFDFFQSRTTSGGSFFGGSGGFPGGPGGFYRPDSGGDGENGGDSDQGGYYATLGIPKTSTLSEVKRAYRRLVVRLHPDKGGDEKAFKALQEAYEVLSDPAKRRLYDAYGKAGVEMGSGAQGGRPEDVFSSFFGSGRARGFGGTGGPRRSPNLYLQVELTLEELFKGATRKVRLNRQKVVDRRLVVEPKVLEAAFERGMQDGARLVLAGEAEGLGNAAPGDIIIQVRELKHPTFVRRNADLLCEMKVTLTEALTGFERPLRHLDGRQLWVKGKAGQVTRPGSVWLLEGEGMPVRGEPSLRGRLFIKFAVVFPP
ncbi:molecular chaperone, partial [Nannochloropsis gaditana CCMP526]|uniref:molecular chaperone n=1 Tax=Nannochloropsis gaditana (strain CCMP526) TaxID=1093141 RepID=UPI00029F5A20